MNATVEPDADGDGFGDDSQDECPTNAATQGACSGTLVGPVLTGDLQWSVGLTFNVSVTAANGAGASPDGSRIPSDGVIVRWRIRSTTGGWAPQVVRPEAGGRIENVAIGAKSGGRRAQRPGRVPPVHPVIPDPAPRGSRRHLRCHGRSTVADGRKEWRRADPDLRPATGRRREPRPVSGARLPPARQRRPGAGRRRRRVRRHHPGRVPDERRTQGACPPEPRPRHRLPRSIPSASRTCPAARCDSRAAGASSAGRMPGHGGALPRPARGAGERARSPRRRPAEPSCSAGRASRSRAAESRNRPRCASRGAARRGCPGPADRG